MRGYGCPQIWRQLRLRSASNRPRSGPEVLFGGYSVQDPKAQALSAG